MFSKIDDQEPQNKASSSSANRKAVPSIISSNLHIVGNLKTDGEIQIDGTIEGDVTARALTVGAQARILGELNAGEAVIHGHVSGKITSKNVRLAKTANVIGDIFHDVLAIEAGAHIEGNLQRMGEETKNRKDGPSNQTAAPKPKITNGAQKNTAQSTDR